jgi:uncharacterized membrane protein
MQESEMFRQGKALVIMALLMVGTALTVGTAIAVPGIGTFEKVKAVNGAVRIPLKAVNDGNAHFFRFAAGDREIAFFLVRGTAGVIRSAFDACDVCYKEKKGYEQQVKDMICRNCNQKFAIDRIGPHEVGDCNPSYLPSRVVGRTIVIAVKDLIAGCRLF